MLASSGATFVTVAQLSGSARLRLWTRRDEVMTAAICSSVRDLTAAAAQAAISGRWPDGSRGPGGIW